MGTPPPSARQQELLELSYAYVLEHGLSGLSLRPLAKAIGSSPRVLLYLFDSKEGLVRALLARARRDELEMLQRLGNTDNPTIEGVGSLLWDWLVDERHRGLLTVWVETYTESLAHPDGAWAGFASTTVDEWLALLRDSSADTTSSTIRATAVLATLRGALLDLLATGDASRTSAAVESTLAALGSHAER